VRRLHPGVAAWAAVASAAAGFAALLVGRLLGGDAVDTAWAPTLGLRLDLSLDGLGGLYGLLATGIAAVVFTYGASATTGTDGPGT
jgi:multicomponent Na+:H+ antiporter subunit A